MNKRPSKNIEYEAFVIDMVIVSACQMPTTNHLTFYEINNEY